MYFCFLLYIYDLYTLQLYFTEMHIFHCFYVVPNLQDFLSFFLCETKEVLFFQVPYNEYEYGYCQALSIYMMFLFLGTCVLPDTLLTKILL